MCNCGKKKMNPITSAQLVLLATGQTSAPDNYPSVEETGGDQQNA